MELFGVVGGAAGSLLGYLIPFLIVLTVVVFIHELGHFLVGRWCGVGVNAFSIGFGPELVGFTDRHGTRWKLSAIPLGGYVKFAGDVNGASVPDAASLAQMSPAERAVSFHHKTVRQRAAVVAAGPIANFLLAIAIFAGITYVERAPDPGPARRRGSGRQRRGACRIQARRPRPLHQRPFDLELHRHAADRQRERRTRAQHRDRPRRPRDDPDRRAGPEGDRDALRQAAHRRSSGSRPRADPDDLKLVKYGLLELDPARRAWRPGTSSSGPSTYIGRLVVGRESADQLSGPIRIAQVSGQVATPRRHSPASSASSPCSRCRSA